MKKNNKTKMNECVPINNQSDGPTGQATNDRFYRKINDQTSLALARIFPQSPNRDKTLGKNDDERKQEDPEKGTRERKTVGIAYDQS